MANFYLDTPALKYHLYNHCLRLGLRGLSLFFFSGSIRQSSARLAGLHQTGESGRLLAFQEQIRQQSGQILP